ncbi:MAG: hypothetical protein EBQ70_12840 [Betaproteobacteria bacterium]|nr:hypothetical protein [Betaproteobacteria bacterium]
MGQYLNSLKKSASGLGGLIFCGCCMKPAVPEGGGGKPGPYKRPPVIINGKQAKTVDIHTHCLFQESIDLMGENGKGIVPPVKGAQEHFIVIEERIKDMDAMGIDMEILSINPYWYKADRDLAEKVCALNNQKLAELCAMAPTRFGAFASLAMQYPDMAVKQLEEAMTKFDLQGAAIGGSVLGDDFCHPKYHPVLAKAEELGATLFIHPQSTPQLESRFKGNGWLANTIGNPLDTTIALEKLIYEGIFDKFPKLKILAAHGGGFLGSYAPRMNRSCLFRHRTVIQKLNSKSYLLSISIKFILIL